MLDLHSTDVSGVEAVALHQGESVVIGRAPPAELAIPDPSLSRQHTRFRLKDGSVQVEDQIACQAKDA